jgi:hypothetical protein
MDRWEIVERRVLLAVGCCMLAAIAWLLLTATVERLVGAGALALCAYWAFWQALYEDRLGSDAPVTRGELILFRAWVWGRRLVLGTVAAVFFLFAAQLARTDPGPAIVVACLGLMAAWVGWFGGGRKKSFSDDRQAHSERKRRYRGIR